MQTLSSQIHGLPWVRKKRKIRQQAFQGYQINDELMAAAKPGAMVMHCLPAYRGQEIIEKIFEEHASEI